MPVAHAGTIYPGFSQHVAVEPLEVPVRLFHAYGLTGVSELRTGAGAARLLAVRHWLHDGYATAVALDSKMREIDEHVNEHGDLIVTGPAITRAFLNCTFLGCREVGEPTPDRVGGITGTAGYWMVELDLVFRQLRGMSAGDDWLFGG